MEKVKYLKCGRCGKKTVARIRNCRLEKKCPHCGYREKYGG